MKDKKSDTFFQFRKNVARYSFLSDKKKSEVSNAHVERLSWSPHKMGNSSVPEENTKSKIITCSRSKSSDNLKKQFKIHKELKKSKSSIFKSSSSTVRNIFSGGSSSPSASSACSSTSSSPKVRQSWASGVTDILERCENDSGEVFDFDQLNENSLVSNTFHPTISKHMVEGPIGKHYLKSGFPIESLLEADEEEEIMITPKIICAHKKTPDVTRKTRNQILLELEYIKEMGMFPEKLNPRNNSKEAKNYDTSFPRDENYPCFNDDLNFNSLIGYKFSPDQGEQANGFESETSYDSNEHICKTQSTSDFSDISLPDMGYPQHSNSHHSNSNQQTSGEDGDDEYFGSFRVSDPNYEPDSVLSLKHGSIPMHDDSEGDESDSLTNVNENESLSFEKRLEANLESLGESGNTNEDSPEVCPSSSSDVEVEKVQFRKKAKPNLHIDINKASGNKSSNEIFLQRFGIDRYSNRSSRSTPRTPRSPAIDIDDLFKQKQRKINEGTKDNLTLVKDLTQRLRLPTKPPSHVEWLNGIKDKAEARQLAEAMSPMPMENSEGVFHLQETSKIPTEQQRTKNISRALLWIKDELGKLKMQDESVARQLIEQQIEMQRLRLVRSCSQHEALLEEVTCEEEEQRAFITSTDLIDLPNSLREGAFSSLRDFGVTRMNLADRRFTLR